MRIFALICLVFFTGCHDSAEFYEPVQLERVDPDRTSVNLSRELLFAIRDGAETQQITEKLASLTRDQLDQSLSRGEERKAFWLNIYNAYLQLLLRDRPQRMESRNNLFSYNLFSTPQVRIAGHLLSLDDIEHGIIRNSRMKYGYGFVHKIEFLTDDFEKRFRLKKLDPRIHFAISYGAASSPRIRIFSPDSLDSQLERATKQFLFKSTDYSTKANRVRLNRLMKWYRGDFGGWFGLTSFLKQYKVILPYANPSVEYKAFDWTPDPENFAKED